MTAQELYEIVKDVDRAAWPKTNGVTYHYRLEEDGPHDVEWWFWGGTEEDPSGHVEARMVLLEAAFVGSMVAWLLDRDIFLAKSSVSGTYYAVDTKSLDHRFGNYKTIIAALAAACKEARP